MRRATLSDVPALVRLNHALQELHTALYPGEFKADAQGGELTNVFSAAVSAEKQWVGVCEGSEGLVAYIWCEEQERPATAFKNSARRLYIHHITLTEGERSQGIGSALMQWAEDQARASGISQIVLDHWADNDAAHRFFGRRGFDDLRIVMRRVLPKRD